MCDDPTCTSHEPQHAITPPNATGTIPLRLVGAFTGSHASPPAGCGYFSGIALKKLHLHPASDLAEEGASRLEVYQAREDYLVQLGTIIPADRILTHRHLYPLMFPQAVGFLTSLGLHGYTMHAVLGSINRRNICAQIDTYMGQQTTHGLMVAHLLSGTNAHWISILRTRAPNRFLVYDSCGAGGFADHVKVITPDQMRNFYGGFPWSHIIGPPRSSPQP